MEKTETEKRIMDLAGQGKNYQQIAEILTAGGIPTFSGKGLWGRGTVFKTVKRLRAVPDECPPEPGDISCGKPEQDNLQTVRSAYAAVLGELDKAGAEIGRLRTEISAKESELADLKTEINRLTQDKQNRQKDMDEMLNTAPAQNRQDGSEGILAEILDRLSAVESRIGMTAKGEKRKAVNISGWTIQRDSRGFYRGFRNIGGRVHGVYLGKSITDDPDGIKQKLTSAFQKVAGNPEKKAEHPAHADRSGDHPDDRQAFKSAYAAIGKGRGFVRIHRMRDFLKWDREKFDRVLTALLADYAVEVHRGDPSILTEPEIMDSYTDEKGTLYITLSLWGELSDDRGGVPLDNPSETL